MSEKFVIRKPRALFRPELKLAPAHPIGNRLIVRAFPPESKTEGGIEVAEAHQKTIFAGLIVSVGDQAADKLYELGIEVGDEVLYARYAGVLEEWQWIVEPGKPADCAHDSVWEIIPRDDKRWARIGRPEGATLRSCRACGAVKLTEPMVALAVDDVIMDVDLQVRLETGVMSRTREQDPEGRPRYVINRDAKRPDSFEITQESR